MSTSTVTSRDSAERPAAAGLRLVYDCESCTGTFDERTVEGVLKRAAANGHGEAITPELERLATAA